MSSPPDHGQPSARSALRRRDLRETAIGLGILLLALIALGVLSGPAAPDATTARVDCQAAVRARLQAPTTAEFREPAVRELGSAWYEVRGALDAENAFGVRLRRTYRCEVRYDGERPLVEVSGL